MTIRWNIKDRKSGQSIIVPGPVTHGECDTLRTILKNCAAMGNQRHGEGSHKHKPVIDAAGRDIVVVA